MQFLRNLLVLCALGRNRAAGDIVLGSGSSYEGIAGAINLTVGTSGGAFGTGASVSVAAGDTMGSHSGWIEKTGYSQSTRPAVALLPLEAAEKATAGRVD